MGVETDGRTVVRLRSPSPRRAVNHNIQRRRRAESRQRDRNEVFATIFSSGLENHLFQSTLLLWESAGAQRRGGLEPDRFSFSQAASSILQVAADDKRCHQLGPEKRMDLRLFVEPAATLLQL